MPTWGEILNEINQGERETGVRDFDAVRRKYITRLHELTGRDVILYATDWLSDKPNTSITMEDMQGLMETCKGLHGPGLDLILNSPGGDPNATASLVRYLRSRFDNIRVFVPLAAMSAATMLALSANEIWMGAHSQLGPIDPQMQIGGRSYPARAILQQFDSAKKELSKDPSALLAWAPILQGYGPSLLAECEKWTELSKKLVRVWLRQYMLAALPDRTRKASRIASYFADYDLHGSHAMGIGRDDARKRGVVVRDLESDPDLQDAVLSIHHAAIHSFQGPAAKIIENHLGKAFVRMSIGVPTQFLQLPIQGPLPTRMVPTT
jgi:hypothetical protein